MARVLCDEDFPGPTAKALAEMGHDVQTLESAGLAGVGTPDQRVLEHATAQQRIVLTMNRRHFRKLHHRGRSHRGIVLCRHDDDFGGLALRIDAILRAHEEWLNRLERANRTPGHPR